MNLNELGLKKNNFKASIFILASNKIYPLER